MSEAAKAGKGNIEMGKMVVVCVTVDEDIIYVCNNISGVLHNDVHKTAETGWGPIRPCGMTRH